RSGTSAPSRLSRKPVRSSIGYLEPTITLLLGHNTQKNHLLLPDLLPESRSCAISAARSCGLNTCEQTFSVIDGLAWPSRRDTGTISSPPAINALACVWRRLWIEILGSFALRIAFRKFWPTLFGRNGWPVSGSENTRASSGCRPCPSFTRSSSCSLRCSRNAATVPGGMVIVRLPRADLGSLKRTPLVLCSSDRRTVSSPRSRSTSDHCS